MRDECGWRVLLRFGCRGDDVARAAALAGYYLALVMERVEKAPFPGERVFEFEGDGYEVRAKVRVETGEGAGKVFMTMDVDLEDE